MGHTISLLSGTVTQAAGSIRTGRGQLAKSATCHKYQPQVKVGGTSPQSALNSGSTEQGRNRALRRESVGMVVFKETTPQEAHKVLSWSCWFKSGLWQTWAGGPRSRVLSSVQCGSAVALMGSAPCPSISAHTYAPLASVPWPMHLTVVAFRT